MLDFKLKSVSVSVIKFIQWDENAKVEIKIIFPHCYSFDGFDKILVYCLESLFFELLFPQKNTLLEYERL